MIKVTDWSGVLAALTLVGTLYAGAIHPLSGDVDRQAAEAATLAEAVVKQNTAINDLRIEVARQSVELDAVKMQLKELVLRK